MSKELIINGQSLPVREYKGQRVVTIKDIARAHGTKAEFIARNFQRNRKYFIEGVDYFHLQGKRATQNLGIGSKNGRDKLSLPSKVSQINIFTESGYLMLVKSMTDELAWKVQRVLVNEYFRNTSKKLYESSYEENLKDSFRKVVQDILPLMLPEYRELLKYRMIKRLTQAETAKLMGVGHSKVEKMEKKLKKVGIRIPKVKPDERMGNYIQLTFDEALEV